MDRIDRRLHKHAFKFAAVALWRANELIAAGNSIHVARQARLARRKAGRILIAVGLSDKTLTLALRRNEQDLADFMEDFGG